MDGAHVLIAGPGGPTRRVVVQVLQAASHQVLTADDARSTVDRVRDTRFDLLLLADDLPGVSTPELIRELKRIRPAMLVVVTGGSVAASDVIEAYRSGAYDYLLEPILPPTLREQAARARELRDKGEQRRRMSEELQQERSRLERLERQLATRDSFAGIVGTSPAICGLVETLREIARTDSTVLLSGESGTGKGLAARAIHAASERRLGPYVEANCVVYSEGVLNSELFGHEKGAFTGADRQKKGRFELARGGTLLLDEIGEISAATQLMLLRVLQERVFERVGGEETLEADVRLIAATNRNMEDSVRRGEFRSDLYYRLNVIPVRVPALREHAEDVPILAQHFLRECAERIGRTVDGFSEEALEALVRYPWPGNIRELENMVERLVVLARGERIALQDLPPGVRQPGHGLIASLPGTLEDIERRRIREVLRECGGNKKRAAGRLGIHRSTLYAKLKRYGLAGDEGASEDSQQPAPEPLGVG